MDCGDTPGVRRIRAFFNPVGAAGVPSALGTTSRGGNMPLPTLTPEQRQQALEKAAEARRKRAELKAQLKSGNLTLATVLDKEDDDTVGKMKVSSVLRACRAWGRSARARSWRSTTFRRRAASAASAPSRRTRCWPSSAGRSNRPGTYRSGCQLPSDRFVRRFANGTRSPRRACRSLRGRQGGDRVPPSGGSSRPPALRLDHDPTSAPRRDRRSPLLLRRPGHVRPAGRRRRAARVGRDLRQPLRDPTGAGRADRKSTRLNSSHVRISYAVFCLKTKTTPAFRLRGEVSRTLS